MKTFIIVFVGMCMFTFGTSPKLHAQTGCSIVTTGCPPADLVSPVCANKDSGGILGAVLNWTPPVFTLSCPGPGGTGYAFTMDFDLPESQAGANCWSFNKVQRVGGGGGRLRLWQSTGSGNPYVTTPAFFLTGSTSMKLDIYAVENFTVNVYLINTTTAVETLATSVNVIGNSTLTPYTFSVSPPSPGIYRVRYEFVSSVSNPSNANYVDRISINAVAIPNCSGDVNFVVESNFSPLVSIIPVGTTTITYTATCNSCTNPGPLTATCSFNVTVNGLRASILNTTPTTCGLANGSVTFDTSLANASQVQYMLDGGSWTTISAPFTINGLSSGGHTLNVRALFGATYCSIITPLNFTINATPDVSNPVITACAANQTANASPTCMVALPNFTTGVTATDNCTATGSLVITQSPAAGTMVGTGVTTVTITVADAAGNTATCTATFTVSDVTAPTITSCGNNLTANANGSCMAAIPNFTGAVTATDNCTATGSLVITQSPTAGTLVGLGVTTVTITVTDAAGNSSTCTRTFTVSDATAPTITSCGSNLTANANGTCMAAVPNFVSAVTATDNCTATGSLVITQSPTAGTMVTTGVTTVTITVTDAAGNSSTCTRTFTVSDATAPTITACAANQTANANGSCMAAVPTFTVTATDNCTATGSLVITQSPAAGTMVTTGVTTVTITVTDAAGNSSTCTRTFTVSDATAPTITSCGSNLTANANGTCMAAVPNFVSAVTATDNCTATGSLVITQSPTAGTMVTTGVTTVTITVTDAAGNSSTCTRTFTVSDVTAPTITACAANQTANANGSCMAAVPTFTVTATDNCTATGSLVITQSPTAGTMVTTGVTNVTITVTDAAGNSSTCTRTFTVSDATAPTITSCGSNLTANADGTCMAAVPNFVSAVTATDNCTATGSLVITQSPAAGTMVTTGVTTVTITVTDAAGNSSTCTRTFTVSDAIAPTITSCGSNLTANANGSCMAAVPNFVSAVTATDNCTATGSLVITQSPTAGTMVTTGVTTVTITVTDAAGNSSTCTRTFTVSDATAPTITSCGNNLTANANGSCMAAVPNFTGAVTATDNCTATGSLVITQSPTAGTMVTTGVTTVTITVTDAAGNSSTCTRTFTVSDATAPTITSCGNNLTANANGSCMAAVPNFTGAVTATDNCTATGSLVITQSPTAGTMVTTGVTTVTITVTDAAGNSSTCTRTFTVSDATAPTITSCGNNLTANANGTCMAAVPNFTGAVTATDNCTAVGSLVITQSPTAGTMVTTGVTTVTITVTDAAGNSSTCTRTFTVSDATAPTIISCGSNLTANANGTCMAAVPNFVSAVTATDNCTATGSLVITQSPTAGTMVTTGVTTVTITVTDAAGNSSTCTRTFTVSDATAPTITSCGSNLTANANGSCMAAVPNFTGSVAATDNCTATGSLVITQSPTAGTMVTTGVTTVTITVTDAAGNSSTCTRTFTVSDATAPTITSCGNNLTANANGSCMAAVPNFVSAVTATDNCTATGSLVITQSPAAGTMVTTGVTTVTITVTDAAGNSSTCTRTFTVSDATAPTITSCGSNLTANANGTCMAAVPNFVSAVTATDNCTATGSLVITQSPAAGTMVTTGVTTVTITVTDAAGNSSTCTRTFTVSDAIAPTITSCGSNLTANANGSCMAAVPNFVSAVTATDNCTATGSLVITQSPTAGTMVTTGVTTVTITVTDAAGNSSTCTRTFTVSDATAPTITSCGNNLTANANGSCMAAVPNFTGAVTATDNCTAVGSLVITQSPTAGTMVTTGVTTVTITVTDAAGNSSTCTRTFTVSDATAPTITSCGNNLTANADGSCMAAVPNFTGGVTATDNCTATGSLVITQSPVAGTMVTTGVTTVTITVTDAAGNSSTCTRTFTVSDATAPTITACAANQTANADGSCMAAVPNFTSGVTATDNCTATGSLVITQSPAAGTMVSTGVTTVTITVTDAAGNSSTCTATFTVSDATAPTITSCAQPQSAFTGLNNCTAAVPNFTSGVSATDNCTATGSLVITQSPAAGTMVGTGVTNVTITVTDAAGNSSSCTTTFTVTDNVKPVITQCAPARTANAGPNCSSVVPNVRNTIVASDNCTPADNLVITQTPAQGTQVGVGTYQITIRVEDAAGNFETCTTTFTVADVTAPTFICPANITTTEDGCGTTLLQIATPAVSDNCPGATIAAVRSDGLTLSDPFPVGTTTITWTAQDASGNTTTCTQTVVVNDSPGTILVNYTFVGATAYPFNANETAPGITSNVTSSEPFDFTGSGTGTGSQAFKQNVGTDEALVMRPSTGNMTRYFQFQVSGANLKFYSEFKVYFQAERLPQAATALTLKYSIDGTNYTTVGTIQLTNQSTWYEAVFDLTGFANLNTFNLNNIYFRIYPSGSDANGSSASTRVEIDNFQVIATGQGPVITCPANQTVTVSAGANCTAIVNPGTATGLSKCGTPAISGTRSDGKPLSDPYPIGVTTITWKATDTDGSFSTCTQTITVMGLIDAVDDNFTPTNPGVIGNALSNDYLNCVIATPSTVTISVVTPASTPNITLNTSTGDVTAADGTAVGTYTIKYAICSTTDPTKCDTAIITVVVDRILPVSGLVLKGSRNNADVHLNWTTLTEQNTSHFIMERSFDGIRFEPIPVGGRVAAAGNSNALRNYNLIDRNVLSNVVYYRVKLYDNNGSMKMSNLVVITLNISKTLKVFPNPVKDFVTIQFGENGVYQIDLIGVNGQLITLQKDVQITNSFRTLTLQRNNLISGQYQMRIWNRTTGDLNTFRLVYLPQ